VGALDGSELRVSPHGRGVYVEIYHPSIAQQERSIERDRSGLFIYNHMFVATERGTGIGRESFARQVVHAQRLGIKKIKAYAAGAREVGSMNGYYTWPRFGYNARLERWERRFLPPELRAAKDLNDLFEMGGADHWKRHGTGRNMVFDLTNNSRSIQLLRKYLEKKERGR
jgi:GNAT superfamily N-acetyltransferase